VLAKKYKLFFGRYDDFHLIISKAFTGHLKNQICMQRHKICVLYDRVVEVTFKMIFDLTVKHDFLQKVDLGKLLFRRMAPVLSRNTKHRDQF